MSGVNNANPFPKQRHAQRPLCYVVSMSSALWTCPHSFNGLTVCGIPGWPACGHHTTGTTLCSVAISLGRAAALWDALCDRGWVKGAVHFHPCNRSTFRHAHRATEWICPLPSFLCWNIWNLSKALHCSSFLFIDRLMGFKEASLRFS